MKFWKHTLPLKDIWADSQQAMDSEAAAIGKRVATRLREQAWFARYNELEDVATRFEYVETLDEFNRELAVLYLWADHEKRCWVETTL